jgi:hypothetical protein
MRKEEARGRDHLPGGRLSHLLDGAIHIPIILTCIVLEISRALPEDNPEMGGRIQVCSDFHLFPAIGAFFGAHKSGSRRLIRIHDAN